MLSGNAVIDGRNLLDPAPPVRVLEREHRIRRPVKVVRDEGYLLIKRLEGVANYPPTPFISTANSCAHFGHSASTAGERVRLIRL
jgi:hypothetical protein